MTVRRALRSRDLQIAFETLAIEGGLLSPEWLARIAQRSAPAQSEADYRVPKGLALRDEIGRYWRIAQAHHRDFASGRVAGADPKRLAESFVPGLLSEAFGFTSLSAAPPIQLAGRTYPIGFAAQGGRVPVVVAPAGSGLDTLAPAFGDGARRRSPFGLAQEFLNAEEGALWGIATDGATLRILRDNASLTRPSWIEADLERIFQEERYADFGPTLACTARRSVGPLWPATADQSRNGTSGHACLPKTHDRRPAGGKKEGGDTHCTHRRLNRRRQWCPVTNDVSAGFTSP